MNKALIYLAAAPLALAPIGIGSASAQEITTESSAVDLAGLLGVSETEASTAGAGSASAGTVTLGGEPVIDGVTGGSQEGVGETSGAVVDTGETPLGSLSVGEYDARVVEGDGGTTSTSSASLLSTTLGEDETITLDVLASQSEASSTGGSSSSSDGVVLDIGGGDLEVVLLHSDSSSDGSGDAFLASVNGQQVVSSEQADGCVVDGDPLVQVICFTAEEGQTTVETEAAVADVEVIEDRLFVTLIGTSAGGAEQEPVEETGGDRAESAALELQDILTISGTQAEPGSASAEVLTLGDETLIGGTQEGDGSESGNVVDTGQTPLGSAAVAPYEATVDGESSRAESSVAEATLVDGETLAVQVLHSESQTGPGGSESSTQGVVLNLGGGELEVVVLDARADGEGNGSAAVATVNGTPVAGSDQADGCVLDAEPLAQVACVTATEGETVIATEAAVADVELVDDQLVVTVGGAGAQTDSTTFAAQSEAAADGNAGNAGGSGDDQGAGQLARALPLTGSELTLLGLIGAGALAAGAGVLVASGRRSAAETG